MTPNVFRRMALGMDDASEGAHMNHPDFRAGGRIFASLHADKKHGMVKLTPEQQAAFLSSHPAMFTPASGAWGRQGYTLVVLSAADEDVVGEAMTLAWQNTAAAAAKKKTARKGATKRSRAIKR